MADNDAGEKSGATMEDGITDAADVYSEMMEDQGGETNETEETEEIGEVEEAEEADETEEAEETEEVSETEAAEEADETEDSDLDDDEVGLSEDEAASLKASAKTKIGRRIGELRRQLTDAETEKETLSQRVETAEANATALQAQFDSVDRGQVLRASGVDPLFAAQDESEIAQAENYWRQVKRYAQRHINSDLGENEDGLIIAIRETDKDGNPVEYTRDDVFSRLEQAEDVLESVVPKARGLLGQRQGYVKTAQDVYPELFDKGSQALGNAMRIVPGLNVLPNAALIVGDMLAGEQLRSKDVSEITVGDRTFVLKGGKSSGKSRAKKPPRLPAKPVPAGSSPVRAKKGSGGQFDHKAIMEAEDPSVVAAGQYENIV